MRFLFLTLAIAVCGAAFGQDARDDLAYNDCSFARRHNHIAAVFLPRAQTQAIAAAAKASAAVGKIPADSRPPYQARLDSIMKGLSTANVQHGKAMGYKALADGMWGPIEARVKAGNWVGVAAAAKTCENQYWKSTGYINSATQGYGGVTGSSNTLVQEVNQFLAMLDAFEDFYGPIPDYY